MGVLFGQLVEDVASNGPDTGLPGGSHHFERIVSRANDDDR